MPETPAIVTLRPTVQIDGRARDRLTELLMGMRMIEAEGGMSGLELRLIDIASLEDGSAEYAFDDEQIVGLGASIEVYAGEEDAPQELFRGKVTALEWTGDDREPPMLTLHAEDALQRARLARRTRVFERATIADIAAQVAQAAGLTSRVSGLTEDLGLQVQYDETDLAFLRRLLARHAADVQVVGRELHVARREDVARGTIALELGAELLAARVAADLADQTTAVTVTGWNPQDGARVSGRSDGAALGPGRGRTGASLLEQKFAPRIEHLGQLVAVTTDDEAQAVARAAFARRARGFVRVDGKAVGNPAIRVGTHVQLRGLPTRWNNTYYVTRAEHCYDLESGYHTLFAAESAYLGDP